MYRSQFRGYQFGGMQKPKESSSESTPETETTSHISTASIDDKILEDNTTVYTANNFNFIKQPFSLIKKVKTEKKYHLKKKPPLSKA